MSFDTEKQPLLSSGGRQNEATPVDTVENPPPYEEPARLAPFGGSPDQLPPYTSGGPGPQPSAPPASMAPPGGAGQSMFVQCRVCQNIIHVASGTQARVVKCTSCNEATPIASPPAGKKYVRCPCNCLLTCSDTASRVVCPRTNCKRTIGVGTISVRPVSTDRIRVVCGRCHKAILWPSNASVAKCPHCRTKSYLYVNWMRYRAISCLAIGIIFILLFIILFGSTFAWAAENHEGIFVLWFGGLFVGVCFIIRSGFYFAMTKSQMER